MQYHLRNFSNFCWHFYRRFSQWYMWWHCPPSIPSSPPPHLLSLSSHTEMKQMSLISRPLPPSSFWSLTVCKNKGWRHGSIYHMSIRNWRVPGARLHSCAWQIEPTFLFSSCCCFSNCWCCSKLARSSSLSFWAARFSTSICSTVADHNTITAALSTLAYTVASYPGLILYHSLYKGLSTHVNVPLLIPEQQWIWGKSEWLSHLSDCIEDVFVCLFEATYRKLL